MTKCKLQVAQSDPELVVARPLTPQLSQFHNMMLKFKLVEIIPQFLTQVQKVLQLRPIGSHRATSTTGGGEHENTDLQDADQPEASSGFDEKMMCRRILRMTGQH